MQLASAQAALNDILPGSPGTIADADSPQRHTAAKHTADARDAATDSDITSAGRSTADDKLRLRNAALRRDRDEWRRRAERLTAEVAALRGHLTAVCAEGRVGETAFLHAQKASPQSLQIAST